MFNHKLRVACRPGREWTVILSADTLALARQPPRQATGTPARHWPGRQAPRKAERAGRRTWRVPGTHTSSPKALGRLCPHPRSSPKPDSRKRADQVLQASLFTQGHKPVREAAFRIDPLPALPPPLSPQNTRHVHTSVPCPVGSVWAAGPECERTLNVERTRPATPPYPPLSFDSSRFCTCPGAAAEGGSLPKTTGCLSPLSSSEALRFLL